MIALFNQFADLALYSIPMALLFLVFLIGYWLAWTDFKPTPITNNEDLRPTNAVESTLSLHKKSRELSKQQLGIMEFDEIQGLNPEVQRRLKMEQVIKDYSISSPEETANVIRGWLNE